MISPKIVSIVPLTVIYSGKPYSLSTVIAKPASLPLKIELLVSNLISQSQPEVYTFSFSGVGIVKNQPSENVLQLIPSTLYAKLISSSKVFSARGYPVY